MRNGGFDVSDEAHLRACWQGRLLRYSQTHELGVVVLSVLSHNYDLYLLALLRAVFPGFESLRPPGLISAAKVDKAGAIVADVILRDGTEVKDRVLFLSEIDMRDRFRKIADVLKLSDPERTELFDCLKRWVVADRRLDPNLDPQDPDAKRLVH